MPLLESLPPQLQSELLTETSFSVNGNMTSALSEYSPVVFETDLSERGDFGVGWLVIDADSVRVYSPNGGGPAELQRTVPLTAIRSAQADTFVGNGVLRVSTDSETIPLARYSQALAGDAHVIARGLNAISRGEEPDWVSPKEDE